jgi:hypothetical protein
MQLQDFDDDSVLKMLRSMHIQVLIEQSTLTVIFCVDPGCVNRVETGDGPLTIRLSISRFHRCFAGTMLSIPPPCITQRGVSSLENAEPHLSSL